MIFMHNFHHLLTAQYVIFYASTAHSNVQLSFYNTTWGNLLLFKNLAVEKLSLDTQSSYRLGVTKKGFCAVKHFFIGNMNYCSPELKSCRWSVWQVFLNSLGRYLYDLSEVVTFVMDLILPQMFSVAHSLIF